MKAARLVGPRQFEVLDVETPTPKAGEVLVRMEHLSVCGSDLITYDRTFPEEEYPLRLGAPCHECAGVVEASQDDRIKPGQRVIALSGGLVEYAAVPVTNIVPLKDGMDPALAVLCQPVGTVLFSCQQIGTILGQRVVVLGQGPIGLSFTDFLARGGARQVIVADRHDYRLEAGRRRGATHTINVTNQDLVQTVTEITEGEGADVAIEACGRPEAANQVFQVLRREGLAVIFGIPHNETVFPFDWSVMHDKLARLITTNSARAGDRARSVAICIDLVAQGRLDLSGLVTHRLPFNEVGQAYELYSGKKDNSLKVVISV